MHSVRSLLAATTTILGLTVLAPPASQAAEPVFTPFTVDKECGASTGFTGAVVSSCTIKKSSFSALKNAKLNYFGPELGANGKFLSSTVVIDASTERTKSTALGHCIVYFAPPATPPAVPALAGMCTFNGGSGKLAGFQAVVKVTYTGTGRGVDRFHWQGVQTHNAPVAEPPGV